MANLVRDLRLAGRRLRRSPLFALFAVLTLAAGIGVTTALYSIVRAVLSPPPGMAHVGRVVNVYHAPRGSIPTIALSWPDYQDFRRRQTVFDKVAGWSFERMAFAANGQTGTGFGEFVGGDYFDALGVRLAAGRALQPADDQPGAPPVVVLSHGVWERAFGGRPDAVGATIRMNGRPFQVVGVAAREFRGLFNSGVVPSAMWAPFSTLAHAGSVRAGGLDDRSSRWVQVRGRLAPGRALADAATEIRLIAAQLDAESPLGPEDGAARSHTWTVRRAADVALNEGADFIIRPLAAVVMAAVGLVLLVACTNLANLMLARGTDRRHEFTVRRALGATRAQLVREATAEGVLVVAAGGAIGIAVARTLMIVLGNDLAVGNGIFLRVEPRLDAVVLATAAAAALLALVVAALVPALHSTRGDLRAGLAAEAHAALPRWRARRLLVSAQVGVSVALVALAALAVAQVRSQERIDRGLDLDRLALAEVDFGAQQYDPARVLQLATTTLGLLRQGSGVETASVSSGLPIYLRNPGATLRPLDEARSAHTALVAASADLFRTVGVRITRGRGFDARDAAGAAPVVVISEKTARALFDAAEPVGRQVRLKRNQWVGDPEHPVLVKTVIGVASEVASTAGQDRLAVYVPFEQQPERHLAFAVRTADPDAALPLLRQTLAAIDPDLALTQLTTGESLAGADVLFFRVMGGLSGVLGAFALVLALAGLYGVLSHLVGRRTREIGLRIALGADRRRVIAMVLRDGLGPVVAGVALGLGAGALARLALRPMFDRLTPAVDPVALAIVPVAMIAAGVLACVVPARRAASVDPNVALKD
jgi:predicted permease